ncbi:TPA: transposase [Streptococcus pyogenes]|nr:Mobile element protein [Streptococcus pyogenes]HEQ3167933.1 transposase [Streptococcus pyogenes]HER0759896.1 transposase [Streptococcus pyogenes]HER0859198.1 transposase [Streptococcus pyogenes]
MSRKGTPYDNALMESFYKTLKRELVNSLTLCLFFLDKSKLSDEGTK